MTTLPRAQKPIQSISRRTVARGVAWAAPAAVFVTASPAMAVSSECEELEVHFQPTEEGGGYLVLTATDSAGSVYTVRITSVLAANTVTEQERVGVPDRVDYPWQGHNLKTTNSGWTGGQADNGDWDWVASGFAPPENTGAIVLNQRVSGMTESPWLPTSTGTDRQTLTFEFQKDGVEFDPSGLSLDIFDITSAKPAPSSAAERTFWRGTYWDAVGFSATPTSIESTGGLYGTGAGAGTLTQPYRREGENQPTNSASGLHVMDRFEFDSFPSGTQMEFTNHGGAQGWHFISLAGLKFDVGNCA